MRLYNEYPESYKETREEAERCVREAAATHPDCLFALLETKALFKVHPVMNATVTKIEIP
jgi:hypothetical protein